MSIEIERKFLLKSDNWRTLGEAKFYQQGYLLIDKSKTIRVRTIDNKGFLTIKGASVGISRNEYEYEIPVEEARVILETLCEKPLIKKFRTKIHLNELVWEVDEFLDDNDGLIIAEVELANENQKIDIPNWIGEEVTGDMKYFNSMLTKNPFNKW
jgi:adenylate cyclase